MLCQVIGCKLLINEKLRKIKILFPIEISKFLYRFSNFSAILTLIRGSACVKLLIVHQVFIAVILAEIGCQFHSEFHSRVKSRFKIIYRHFISDQAFVWE